MLSIRGIPTKCTEFRFRNQIGEGSAFKAPQTGLHRDTASAVTRYFMFETAAGFCAIAWSALFNAFLHPTKGAA
jgi:hypothetical protein